MGGDLRKLGPSALCRLLNSTDLGPVVTTRQLSRHRDLAGLRIGTGSTIDLLKYTAWLVDRRHDPKSEGHRIADPYERVKEAARARAADVALSGRDIGELPAVVNPERKAACRLNFRLFCESYYPHVFHLEWSEDHLKVIAQTEEAVLRGGLFATAMPRGSGKTSIAEAACTWAVLYGHHEFVVLIGSDEGNAEQMLDSIKTNLESNERLAEDFPEVTYPIACLEGIPNRCNGQLYHGARTHIGWTTSEVILPMLPGSSASSAIIRVAGLTGCIRGLKFTRPDGRVVRPSLVVPDDPQTDQSARSPSQCETRENILAGAVLGLAGPGRKIAGIMPCTVIRTGDLADRILDREKNPDWNGTRTKMVYAWPTNAKLWEEYARIRADSLRAGNGGREATEFYRLNQAAMDEGARVAWPARFKEDEISALQHAMNLKLRNERAFAAEYQNEPLPDQEARSDDLTADQIASKVNGLDRGLVPLGCNWVTAFIDVQGSLLFYVVTAWKDDFTGYVIDYGTYPDQQRPYFTLSNAKITLAMATKAGGLEGQIYEGLNTLTGSLLTQEWERDDGAAMKVDRCLIDANWAASTDTVYQFCRQSEHSSVLMPSHGKYVGAASKPMREYHKHPGDRVGHNWRMPNVAGRRAVRYVNWDTNYWKSFVHTRLAVAMADRGCLSLWGTKPDTHRLFADHLTAEFRVRLKHDRNERVVDQWQHRPERPDNHWFDCLVGCAVAASILGAVLPEATGPAPAKKRRVTFAELRQRLGA